MNLRFTEADIISLKGLSKELNISLSDAVRECVKFTFTVAPVLKEITIWDAIANINPEFLEEITKMKVGGNTNGNSGKPGADTDKKV
jgi:hypothetical protein